MRQGGSCQPLSDTEPAGAFGMREGPATIARCADQQNAGPGCRCCCGRCLLVPSGWVVDGRDARSESGATSSSLEEALVVVVVIQRMADLRFIGRRVLELETFGLRACVAETLGYLPAKPSSARRWHSRRGGGHWREVF